MVKIRDRGELARRAEAFGNGAQELDYQDSPQKVSDSAIVKLTTDDCVLWKYHNRNDGWFGLPAAKTLQESIEKHGQQHPGLVRPATTVAGVRYEIICGARRWASCRNLGVMFEAKVLPADTPDSVCASLMEDENEQSENVTEIERGLCFRAMLEGELFESQSELSRILGASHQYVNKIVRATTVFDEVWLAKALKPHVVNLSVAQCRAISAALETHGGQGRMHKALEGADAATLEDVKKVVALLLSAVERPSKEKETVLLRKGKRKAAICRSDGKGGVVLKVDTRIMAEDQVEDLLRLFKDQLIEHLAKGVRDA